MDFVKTNKGFIVKVLAYDEDSLLVMYVDGTRQRIVWRDLAHGELENKY